VHQPSGFLGSNTDDIFQFGPEKKSYEPKEINGKTIAALSTLFESQ